MALAKTKTRSRSVCSAVFFLHLLRIIDPPPCVGKLHTTNAHTFTPLQHSTYIILLSMYIYIRI